MRCQRPRTWVFDRAHRPPLRFVPKHYRLAGNNLTPLRHVRLHSHESRTGHRYPVPATTLRSRVRAGVFPPPCDMEGSCSGVDNSAGFSHPHGIQRRGGKSDSTIVAVVCRGYLRSFHMGADFGRRHRLDCGKFGLSMVLHRTCFRRRPSPDRVDSSNPGEKIRPSGISCHPF